MRQYWTLISKPFVEWYNSLSRKGHKDILGLVFSLLLVVALFYVYVRVGSAAIDAYLSVMVDGVYDVASRKYEALTMFYGVVILAGVLSSTRSLSLRLFENDDNRIYLTLPVSPIALFMSQIALVYMRQFAMTFVYVMTINAMFAVVAHEGALFIMSSILTSILIPFLTMALASFLAFPYYYLKRVLGAKHIIMLIIVTVVAGLVFWGYSYIIDLFSQLLASGELRFFFSEATMNAINNVTTHLYPANFYAAFNMGIDRAQNFFIILGLGVGAGAIGVLISSRLFTLTLQGKMGGSSQVGKYLNVTAYSTNSFAALVNKEFVMVLRSPSYAFQYFSTALIMPLMVVLCMEVGVTLLDNMVGVSCNFELAIFSIIIFGMLTNTLSATNISRDGSAFWLMKTSPISPRRYLMAKVVFASIISVLSVTIACISLACMGLVSALEGLFVWFIGLVFSVSEVFFATKCDLMHPHFEGDDEDEIDSSNSVVSMVIVLGLVSAIVVGGCLLLIKIWGALHGTPVATWISYILAIVFGLLAIGVAVGMFFYKIDHYYDRLTEGDV